MRTIAVVSFAIGICLAFVSSARAQNDEAPKKTIKRIVEEIDLVPSLYARGEDPIKAKALPKFSVVKLVAYPVPKKQTAEMEREAWKKNKEQYATDFPLRAAIFEAADALEKAQLSSLAMTFETVALPEGVLQDGKVRFPPSLVSQTGCVVGAGAFAFVHPVDQGAAQAKRAILARQEPIGRALFQLEGVYEKMKEAAGKREKEASRRWQANFDFAFVRLETDILFLYEYNYSLGQIRADALPDLGPGDVGWKINFTPKINVTEMKAKVLAKDRLKQLQRIQEEHPGTPWAHFAERESTRALGMVWGTRKK